jgi:hypothetical protein
MSSCIFNYISATELVTYSTNIGNGVNNVFVVPHNLGTKDVSVTVRDTQTNLLAYPAIEVITLSSVSVSFNFVPALTAYDITIFAAASGIRVEPFSDRVVINIDEQPAQNVTVSVSSVGDNVNVNVIDFLSQWGSIVGTISAQTDLWAYLSTDSDFQTLFYTPSSIQISISNGNTITLDNLITKTQALAYSIAL